MPFDNNALQQKVVELSIALAKIEQLRKKVVACLGDFSEIQNTNDDKRAKDRRSGGDFTDVAIDAAYDYYLRNANALLTEANKLS